MGELNSKDVREEGWREIVMAETPSTPFRLMGKRISKSALEPLNRVLKIILSTFGSGFAR